SCFFPANSGLVARLVHSLGSLFSSYSSSPSGCREKRQPSVRTVMWSGPYEVVPDACHSRFGSFISGTRLLPCSAVFAGNPHNSTNVGYISMYSTTRRVSLPGLVTPGAETTNGAWQERSHSVNFCQWSFSPRCQP